MQVLISFTLNETLGAIASVLLTPWLYKSHHVHDFPCRISLLELMSIDSHSFTVYLQENLTWHESSFFQFSKICFSLCKWVTWFIVPLPSQMIDLGTLQTVTWLPHHIHADAGIKAFWQKCRKSTLPYPQQPSPFYKANYRLCWNTVIFQQIFNLFSQLARYV